MATPTLVSTPGASNANSYLTVAEADAYHDSRLSSTDWSSAATDIKTVALIMGTRILDAMYDWRKTTSTDEQVLLWPRDGLIDYKERNFIENTIIPEELKNAVAELARQLIIEDRTLDNDISKLKINSLTAGPVSLGFGEGVEPQVIPDAVFWLIPRWWGQLRERRPVVIPMAR